MQPQQNESSPAGEEAAQNTQEGDRHALHSLAESLRAHLEWCAVTGAHGLPPAPPAPVVAVCAEPTVEAPPTPASPKPATAGPSPVAPPEARKAPPAAAAAAAVAPAAPASPGGARAVARAPVPAVPADPAARRVRLDALAAEVRACQRCALAPTRTQTVFARGNPAAELVFVGEGPGADEDAQGLPFVGRAGQLLDRMIVAMGFSPADVYICNIVKCRPPENRKPEPAEAAACGPFLAEQLALVAPKVIVALGATAVEFLLGMATVGITRMRGQWKLYRGTTPVMPTFHPAYLLRNPAAKREAWLDLQAVMVQLGRPVPPAAKG